MEIVERELSRKEIVDCSKLVTINYNKMSYKKYGKGQYEIYCPFCQTYKRINTNELRMIQHNGECPTCFKRFRGTTTIDTRIVEEFVEIDNYGYRFKVKWEFGKPIETLETEQCMFFADEDKTYVKDLYLANFGRSIRKCDLDYRSHEYRLSHSTNWKWNTYKYPNNEKLPLWLGNPNLIKKIALENELKNINIKSNQKKMMIDNLFTIAQAKFVHIFDLNDAELVYKYADYLKENSEHSYEFIRDKIVLNKYYLDYLVRNKIDLGTYYHFLSDLKTLGFKYEKPTDFAFRFNKVKGMIREKEEEIRNNNIAKRYKELPKYKSKEVTISPFKTADEIINCGKALHNCIGGYVRKYADGDSDIYHLDVGGKLTCAIEVWENELHQAYIDGNKKCPDKLMKHIKKWCEKNKINLGIYA